MSEKGSSDSGFPLGTMPGDKFCRWINSSSTSVKESVVRHVTWWNPKHDIHPHDFLLITVTCYTPESKSSALYDIRFEMTDHLFGRQLAKVKAFFGIKAALDHSFKVTISESRPLPDLHNDNTLIFGMLGAGLPPNSPEARVLSRRFFFSNAFCDPLDDKWRGPPAMLWHISRYIEIVDRISNGPKGTKEDHLTHLLMYAIGLRHYSFAWLASSDPTAVQPRHAVLDPSGIGMLFRIFPEILQDPAVFDYGAYLASIASGFLALAVVGATIYGTIVIHRGHPKSQGWVFLLVVIWIVLGCMLACILAWILEMQDALNAANDSSRNDCLTPALVDTLGVFIESCIEA
jgi:uncharacterized membrane protein